MVSFPYQSIQICLSITWTEKLTTSETIVKRTKLKNSHFSLSRINYKSFIIKIMVLAKEYTLNSKRFN